jgi:phosphoserine phosphatase RsbU/P
VTTPASDAFVLSADLVERLEHRVAELEQQVAVERTRTREHVRLAEQVHRSLLPLPARTDRAEVDVRYQPLDGVGGDYCQMHFPSESVCYVTLCDVSGHGVGPALLATRVSSEVRHSVDAGHTPAEVVDRLNRFVCANFAGTGLLLTFFAARIDLARFEITWSGAGHPSPIVVRADGRTVMRLPSQNRIIGVLPDCLAAEPEHRSRFGPGDRVLFYTDGVTEVFDASGAELGEDGLASLMLHAMPAGACGMIDRILEQVAAFQHGPVTDDRTLILFGARTRPRHSARL